MEIPLSKTLYELSERTFSHIYLVGGSVRNYILFGDSVNTDMDICGELPAEKMFPPEVKIICVNKRLGTYKVIYKNEEYEYTPFRREKYTKGHTPDEVSFDCDIEEDAKRRDFTINAIYYDVTSREIVDPLNGCADIQKHLICKISDSTLAADGLRLMRAIRFACQLNFEIEDDTMSAIKKNAYLITEISPERIRDELNKILISDTAYGFEFAQYKGVELLKESGILAYILPELAFCDGVKQNPKYHAYDVLEHIFQTVKFSRCDIRLAALLHDVGKPHCIDNQGHMKGHDIIGAELTRTIMKRLRFSNAETEETATLVGAHMFDLKGEASESKVKFFVVKNFELIDKIIELKRADYRACGLKSDTIIDVSEKLKLMKEKIMSDGTPLSLKNLEINGDDLREMGARGCVIREILNDLFRDCVLDPKLNNREWLLRRAKKMVNIYKIKSNIS